MGATVILGLTVYFAFILALGKLLKMADDAFDEDGLT